MRRYGLCVALRWLRLHGDPTLTLVDPRDIADVEVFPDGASAAARQALVDFWQRRADGEWTTAAALSHVRDDMTVLGAPAPLRDLVDIAVADEHRHTQWCSQMAVRLGGVAGREPRVLGHRPLAFDGLTESENRVVRAIFAGCISETIALHVLRESQADLPRGAIFDVNRQHMAEEVGHARVGWAFLAWLAAGEAGQPSWRPLLERTLPVLLELAGQSWRGGARDDLEGLRCVGFLAATHVEHGIQRALHEVIVPGFERFGIPVPKPWLRE